MQPVEVPLQRIDLNADGATTGGDGEDTGVVIERPPQDLLIPPKKNCASRRSAWIPVSA
ncbi:MAG: hypothetical protein K2X93_00995 [Candidatus Obscuribacterales bacterium]|nr:hypothetical protein [Candidatus Obscuribacterales bacterium]